MENDKTVSIQSADEIPLGHKIAMVDLKELVILFLNMVTILVKLLNQSKKVSMSMFTM